MFPLRDLNPTRIFPVITLGLILINVLVFFWQPSDNFDEEVDFLYENAVVACEITSGEALSEVEIQSGVCDDQTEPAAFPEKNIWIAVFVSMFLHGGLGHLLSNMWFLWLFGNNVEEGFGTGAFVFVYLVSGLGAAAAFILANPDSTIPMIGASGAIAGVLGSYLVLFPRHRILTIFIFFFIRIPAGAYLALWFFLQFAYQDPGVAWEAHVGGFVVGVLVTLPLRSVLLGRIRRLHKPTPQLRMFR